MARAKDTTKAKAARKSGATPVFTRKDPKHSRTVRALDQAEGLRRLTVQREALARKEAARATVLLLDTPAREEAAKTLPDTGQREHIANAPKRWEARDQIHRAHVERDHARIGAPVPEFDVPLVRGGVAALLTCADLETQEGADRFLSAFMLASEGSSPPSLEQLQMAQEIVRGVGLAILQGNNEPMWKLARDAHKALFSVTDKRRAVVSMLHDLRQAFDVCEWEHKKYPNLVEAMAGLEPIASTALETLATLDEHFQSVSAPKLLRIVGARKSAVGIATTLSILCGAFGDVLTDDEKDRKASNMEHRIRGFYEAAISAPR
jgi:hypothetical protein